MIIDSLELEERRLWLEKLLLGYRAMLSSPDIDSTQLTELQEGFVKNEKEYRLVLAVINSFNDLVSYGYPDHKQETASQVIIDALKRLADAVSLVPKDFDDPVILADNGQVKVN